MISNFFLKRPIFATVLTILIVLGGIVALYALSIEQYPNIVPPQVQITVSYPGASAKTIVETVAAPLEEQINGVDKMIYMYSESSDTGNLTLNVFFEIGSDINQSLNNVQDRVDIALGQLPEEVRREGVIVKKQTPTMLMLVALESPEGRYNELHVNNYATIHIAEELQRLKGVSNAQVVNARNYSMRVWLRPDKMAQLGISTTDIVNAIQEQNMDYPLGELGMQPTQEFVPLAIPVTALGRLSTPEQYEQIILRANSDGGTVTIGDVGRAELGAQDYSIVGSLNQKSAALIAVYQEYGANALNVAAEVKATLRELAKRLPPGLEYSIPYDTTTYIKESINEVKWTLYAAAILVALVVFVFLQSLRATLIPIIAMGVSIIGTFAGMYLLGFSLNSLTLFGLILAIGIVVDDAIVVVENIERNMREKNLGAKEAAVIAMSEVSGPIIAIVFVLCAVFVPVAFLGGIAGALYKQFALTIAISVVFSGIIALTFSPVLAVFLFSKPRKSNKFADLFNHFLHQCTEIYAKGAGWLLKHSIIGIMGFVCVLGSIFLLLKITPVSFVPQEDQGYLITFAYLPDGANLDRTEEVGKKVGAVALKNPAVKNFIALNGFSLMENLSRTTVGTYFVQLKDWKDRKTKAMQADGVLENLAEEYAQLPGAYVLPFNPPAIQGLGTVGGFEFWIINKGEGDVEALDQMTHRFIEQASSRPELNPLTTAMKADCMQLYAELNRTKARALKVSIGAVYQTLQSMIGSVYVNNFNKYGHVFNVMVQADPAFRTSLEEIGNIYVRSEENEMIPLKALVTFRHAKGANLFSRFNNFNDISDFYFWCDAIGHQPRSRSCESSLSWDRCYGRNALCHSLWYFLHSPLLLST